MAFDVNWKEYFSRCICALIANDVLFLLLRQIPDSCN